MNALPFSESPFNKLLYIIFNIQLIYKATLESIFPSLKSRGSQAFEPLDKCVWAKDGKQLSHDICKT